MSSSSLLIWRVMIVILLKNLLKILFVAEVSEISVSRLGVD